MHQAVNRRNTILRIWIIPLTQILHVGQVYLILRGTRVVTRIRTYEAPGALVALPWATDRKHISNTGSVWDMFAIPLKFTGVRVSYLVNRALHMCTSHNIFKLRSLINGFKLNHSKHLTLWLRCYRLPIANRSQIRGASYVHNAWMLIFPRTVLSPSCQSLRQKNGNPTV